MEVNKVQIAINRLKCGNTAHSCKADYIKLAIKALEKQIPKKPEFDFNFGDTLSRYHCACGNIIKVNHDLGVFDNHDAPNYCSKCGQKLDWSEEKEE